VFLRSAGTLHPITFVGFGEAVSAAKLVGPASANLHKDGSNACLTITGTVVEGVVRRFANGLSSRGKPMILSDRA
jgi:hypothetical protein